MHKLQHVSNDNRGKLQYHFSIRRGNINFPALCFFFLSFFLGVLLISPEATWWHFWMIRGGIEPDSVRHADCSATVENRCRWQLSAGEERGKPVGKGDAVQWNVPFPPSIHNPVCVFIRGQMPRVPRCLSGVRLQARPVWDWWRTASIHHDWSNQC